MEKEKKIVKKRVARISVYLLLFCCFVYFLILCSRIPHKHVVIENLNDSTTIERLKVYNPSSLSSFGALHDLSTVEYTLNCPYVSGEHKAIAVMECYNDDSLYTFYGSNLATYYSGIEGGESTSISDVFFIMPMSEYIHFYTKNVAAENAQMVRNLFLTEIILFLLAVIGRELYKIISDIFCERKYIIRRVFGTKEALYHMVLYIFLLMITAISLFSINRVPRYEIRQNNYIQKNRSVFSLFDISCSYYHLYIPAERVENQSVEWRSKEIVEFIPKEFAPLSAHVGSKSVTFKKIPDGQDFETEFFTRNLQSENYQDIRLFILTTLLLFFLERSIHYFRKWWHNRKIKAIL